ncbi:hypothetical protein CC78DRAFT_576839 [Lojkania enalia]|uniref:DUF7730 domain-containing protein n=1 Tax=Lojkania enalia TaxID=147567 RepID=A0A9P4KFP6_9PLEO|nr:hypothetical protein CC78DRAFT_576839 [Didymosphaeria enalia]
MTMEEYTFSRQDRDFRDARPSPLSETRPRRLTPSLEASNSLRLQSQSRLLTQLPSEIRLTIWGYTIGYQKIHIISKFRRLGHAICDAQYWRENRSEQPGLRASSYMFTYGSLPTTKQLADWSICNLLRTCRQMYLLISSLDRLQHTDWHHVSYVEATPILYQTNTFVFWDLRVVQIFKDSILPSRWQRMRSMEIYAFFYRNEDIQGACEARSQLQLTAWPIACSALETLSSLRRLRIFIGNPFYLDSKYLIGGRTGLYRAVLKFLKECRSVRKNCALEIFLPLKRRGVDREASHWSHYAMKDRYLAALEAELRDTGLDCGVFVGDNLCSEEEIGMRMKFQGYK